MVEGGRGGGSIQFGISIYGGSYWIENMLCHFYMSDGCVIVENSGVSLFRNVTGWSFPWAELSAVVLMFGQAVPSFRNAKIQLFWCLLKRNISLCFAEFYDMPFRRKERWTDTWLLLCIECSYLKGQLNSNFGKNFFVLALVAWYRLPSQWVLMKEEGIERKNIQCL